MASHPDTLPGFDNLGPPEPPAQPFDPRGIAHLGRGSEEDAAARQQWIFELHYEENVRAEQGAPRTDLVDAAPQNLPPMVYAPKRPFRRRGGNATGPNHHDDPRIEANDPNPPFDAAKHSVAARNTVIEESRSTEGFGLTQQVLRGIVRSNVQQASGRDSILRAALLRKHGVE